jgi:hypothetical protein
MRLLITLLTMSCICSCWGKDTGPRVVVERTSGWNASPVYPENLTADAQIVVFYSDGRFGVINAILGKSSRGHEVSVLLGEGYSIFSGCWAITDRKINAIAAPVYLPSPITPKPEPRKYEFVFSGNGLITSRRIKNQLDPNRPTESIQNIRPITDILESRTKNFESSSGSTVWHCAGNK